MKFMKSLYIVLANVLLLSVNALNAYDISKINPEQLTSGIDSRSGETEHFISAYTFDGEYVSASYRKDKGYWGEFEGQTVVGSEAEQLYKDLKKLGVAKWGFVH